MISILAWLLVPFFATAHADHHKLFRVCKNGGPSSYLLGTTKRAWFASVEDVPVEIRRAIQKSNVVVLAGTNDDGPVSELSERSKSRLKSESSVIDRLGLSAREAYFKILPIRTALASEYLHPAIVLMLGLEAHFCRQREEDDDFEPPPFVDVDEDLDRLVREVIGGGANEWSLADLSKRSRERAAGGRVMLHGALRELARRAGAGYEVIPATGATEGMLDIMVDTVDERDLESGLLHLAREAAEPAERRFGRRLVLEILHSIVGASYLVVDHDALERLRVQDVSARLEGLERFRQTMADRRTLWMSNLQRRMARGGTFVATELQNVFASGGPAAPGLKEILEGGGLDVTAVEIDCSSSLLSTNVAPYQGTTRSTPWRLKLLSASSNPTP